MRVLFGLSLLKSNTFHLTMLPSTRKTINWKFHSIALRKNLRKPYIRQDTGVAPAPCFVCLFASVFLFLFCFVLFVSLLAVLFFAICLYVFFVLFFFFFFRFSFSFVSTEVILSYGKQVYFVLFPLRFFPVLIIYYFFIVNSVLLCLCWVLCFVVCLFVCSFQSLRASSPLYEYNKKNYSTNVRVSVIQQEKLLQVL